MQNLIAFFRRFRIFIFFFVLQILSLGFYVHFMEYPRSVYFTSASTLIGDLHALESKFTDQLQIRHANHRLQQENIHLRKRTFANFYQIDKSVIYKNDTAYEKQFEYIQAEIINSNISHRNNYFTINIGTKQGVHKGLGVISPNGILGIVFKSSEHYSLVKTILTKDINTDVMIGKKGIRGILKWDGISPKYGNITGISNDLHVGKWTDVYTLGESGFFPKGIKIGKVVDLTRVEGQALWDVRIKYYEDYRTLQNVYVIKNLLNAEKRNLELSVPNDEVE